LPEYFFLLKKPEARLFLRKITVFGLPFHKIPRNFETKKGKLFIVSVNANYFQMFCGGTLPKLETKQSYPNRLIIIHDEILYFITKFSPVIPSTLKL